MLSLNDHQFRVWIHLLAAASEAEERGTIPPYPMRGLAAALQTTEEELAKALDLFEELHMVNRTEEGSIVVTNFVKRQYDKPSDQPEATRDRKKRQRDRQETAFVTPISRPCHATDLELDLDSDTDTDPEKTQNTPPPTPSVKPADIVFTWDEICGDVLPKVSKLTRKRLEKLSTRRNEDPVRNDLAWWQTYFKRVRASPFLTGDNDRSWRADFDWVIASDNVVARILEGKYDPQERRDQHGQTPADRRSPQPGYRIRPHAPDEYGDSDSFFPKRNGT